MAITLESNYSKKIGLPGYSSHQYSLTVRTEISDLSQVEQESTRLYLLLQNSVDGQIKETGFLPGQSHEPTPTNKTNGNGNGHHPRNGKNGVKSEPWQCSPKQQDLILKLIEEQGLSKDRVEALAHQRVDKGVRQLNKLEASGLIEELMENSPTRNSRIPATK